MDLIRSLNLPLTRKLSARPPVTTWSDILRCCAKGFYGIHTTFPCPSSTSHYPSWVAAWTGCPESGHICSVPCVVGWGHLFLALAMRNLQIQTLASST
jgi:hypothetical protein